MATQRLYSAASVFVGAAELREAELRAGGGIHDEVLPWSIDGALEGPQLVSGTSRRHCQLHEWLINDVRSQPSQVTLYQETKR